MAKNVKSASKKQVMGWLEEYIQGRTSHLESFKKLEQSFTDSDMGQIVKGLTYALETDVKVLNLMLGMIKRQKINAKKAKPKQR